MLRIRARPSWLVIEQHKDFIKLLRTSTAILEYMPISHGRGNISRRGEISTNINKCMINSILDKIIQLLPLYNFQTTVIMTTSNIGYNDNHQQQLYQQLATTIITTINNNNYNNSYNNYFTISRQFTSQQVNNKYIITIHFTSSYSTTIQVTV